MIIRQTFFSFVLTLLLAAPHRAPAAAATPETMSEGDYVAANFRFVSGETIPELRLHYVAFGKPHRNERGQIDNAVLILHGMGGSGHGFISDRFAGVLFGKGQILDARRYYIILPDAIGHGNSSKPSDGLHARFPRYDYVDMVNAQYTLVTQGLKIDHLRLVLGTSLGCRNSWIWGESHPEFVDALMPIACLPAQTARERVWRRLIVSAIENDPSWKQGDYREQPQGAMLVAASMILMARSAPLEMQNSLSTPALTDEFVKKYLDLEVPELDANDLLYQLRACDDYDSGADLEKIRAPVMWVNAGDDFLDPPELAIADNAIKHVKSGRYILLPASDQSHGSGIGGWPSVWQQYLKALLESPPP